MRTINLIIGVGYIFVSLPLALMALAGLAFGALLGFLLVASCFLACVSAGGFFIYKSNRPIRGKFRMMAGSVLCLALGISLIFIIPSLVYMREMRQGNACVNNLRQIDAAKNEWALEKRQTNGAVVTEDDIKPYIKLNAQGNIPGCPLGGQYTLGRLGEDPVCSIGISNWPNSHVLDTTKISRWKVVNLAYRRLWVSITSTNRN